ncbi:asparagine synthetase [glutamine-hydrolyzing]-like [Ciona intestinalis]
MCGIWAIFGSDNNNADILKNVFRVAHRGMKSFRVCNLPQLSNCVLGFHQSRTTAAQNDGMQPMALKQFPHLTLLCDGVIYNYKQLQKEFSFSYESNSECEVILHLYNTLGAEKTCQLLDGVFAFAIIDVIKKQVVLSRDTFGVRPLFQVKTSSGVFGICSEAKVRSYIR